MSSSARSVAGNLDLGDAELVVVVGPTASGKSALALELAEVAERAREHQDGVVQTAKALDLDVVRVGLDQTASDIALSEFVAERRVRKTYN